MIDNLEGKAINKLNDETGTIREGADLIEITVIRRGEVLYHNKAYAGLFCSVQSIDSFDKKEGTIEGDSQVYAWGHPLAILFAWDQQRQKLGRSGIFHLISRLVNKLRKEPEEKVKDLIKGLNGVIQVDAKSTTKSIPSNA